MKISGKRPAAPTLVRATVLILVFAVAAPVALTQTAADADVIARIREEGLQRSQVMDIAGYIVDVLGARLTNSEHMKRAQDWVKTEMEKLGLENVVIEPFMDYGVTWDNEYTSLHLLEPDYQPMVGYPLAHTPGTNGRLAVSAVIAEIRTKADLAAFRGKLKGLVVLASPPVVIDQAALSQGVARLTDDDLRKIEENAVPHPQFRRTPSGPANPDLLKPEEKIAFYKSEGALAVFQCDGGRPGLVPGYSRPATRDDHWSRAGTLASLPILEITPEHYNRMYRILKRSIPVKVEVEVRNRIGADVMKAANVLGEIPGSDLRDEIVMVGAHFDSWHASPNASDDASGCAVALEAARILKALGLKPRRTIRIALWGGEEQGLFGSREYVRMHFGDPKDPKAGLKPDYEKFSVYFNQDYGAGQFRGVYLQGNERARATFAAWIAPFHDFGLTVLSIQSVGSTDHVSFDEAGLPGFQFLQDRIAGTAGHTNLDFLDTLSPDDLMKNAVVMAAFAWNAAMSDTRMPRKSLKTGAETAGAAR